MKIISQIQYESDKKKRKIKSEQFTFLNVSSVKRTQFLYVSNKKEKKSAV
jgi:hypothetical protein